VKRKRRKIKCAIQSWDMEKEEQTLGILGFHAFLEELRWMP